MTPRRGFLTLSRLAVAAAAVVIALSSAACGSDTRHPSASAALGRAGLVLPASYEQACANESAVCLNASGPIPSTLNRPLHFPAIRAGQPCPATPGSPIATPYFAGVALGAGLVRPLIASAGDLRHGIADLDASNAPGWREFKTLWFSAPAYQGPFVIRARQLGGADPIRLGGSGELPATAAPVVVPPGPTLNGGGGWRTAPAGTWTRGPGCFAWQVDGLTFSEIIVVHAVLHPRRGG